jgi:(S)-ureidoglycine-glyoxylate aminotransferase
MGYSSNKRNVLLTLGALKVVLKRHGFADLSGDGVQAAMDQYAAIE